MRLAEPSAGLLPPPPSPPGLVAITDLLRAIPNPLDAIRAERAAGAGLPSRPLSAGDGAARPVAPPVLETGLLGSSLPDGPVVLGWAPLPFDDEVAVPWSFPEPLAPRPGGDAAASSAAVPAGLARAAGLCLGLSVACAVGALALLADGPAAGPPTSQASAAPAGAAPAAPLGASSAGTAEPTPLPAEAIARLEAAADDALPTEFRHLLDAMAVAFGTDSARLDPALRAYVFRLAQRLEWTPDRFRVTVAAPSQALATARADLLLSLFAGAIAARQLVVEPVLGPHALTLVSE